MITLSAVQAVREDQQDRPIPYLLSHFRLRARREARVPRDPRCCPGRRRSRTR